MINIALITDNNYIEPTIVSIVSMIHNKSDDSEYTFYIVTNNINEDNKNLLYYLSNDKVKIIIVEATNYLTKFKNVVEVRHVSVSAILKFYLPEIFRDLSKLLYIDADTLVQTDLTELYNTNIDEKYAAVVMDTHSVKYIHKSKLNLKRYFNSGMMLLNLEYMRQNNATEKLINYKIKNLDSIFMDQDSFNAIFNENVYFLSYKYNFLIDGRTVMTPKELAQYYNEPVKDDEKEFYDDCKIIHLASKYKPWKYDLGYLTKLYKKYWNAANILGKFPEIIPYTKRPIIKRKGLEYIFSIKNSGNDLYKIVTIFFITFKIKRFYRDK